MSQDHCISDSGSDSDSLLKPKLVNTKTKSKKLVITHSKSLHDISDSDTEDESSKPALKKSPGLGRVSSNFSKTLHNKKDSKLNFCQPFKGDAESLKKEISPEEPKEQNEDLSSMPGRKRKHGDGKRKHTG